MIADTRTNAGLDNVGTYRKIHTFAPGDDRVFVIESAGSLATTQEVMDRIEADLASGHTESLATVDHLFEAALYLGRLGKEVSDSHREGLARVGVDATATFILGGQIRSADPDILLVYPEGNYIRASDERPFLQIGESKYGKFLLELAAETRPNLSTAVLVALGSMMSTASANLSVGPPYDLAIYRNGSNLLEEYRITADSPLLADLRTAWEANLMEGLHALQRVAEEELQRRLPSMVAVEHS